MSTDQKLGTKQFRILVVDDDKAPAANVARAFENDTDVEVVPARTADEAHRLIPQAPFDAAVVDIQLGGRTSSDQDGLEVIRALGTYSPNAAIVVATSDLSRFPTSAERSRRIVAVRRKGAKADEIAREELLPALTRFRESEVVIEGFDHLRQTVTEKLSSEVFDSADGSPDGLGVELDRLFRAVFGNLSSLEDGSRQPARIKVESLELHGMSAAVVLKARVRLPALSGEADDGIDGGVVAIKIGPVNEIKEEAERFERFVRFGVPLRHRVELDGWAEAGVLGLICYGFAGGGVSEVRSLDLLVENPTTENQAQVLRIFGELFEKDEKQWYAVEGPKLSLNGYLARRWSEGEDRDRFQRILKLLNDFVRELSDEFAHVQYREAGDHLDGYLKIGEHSLWLPGGSYWAQDLFMTQIDTCIVHGDMHGGNVLLVDDPLPGGQNVALIDYGASGFGPRLFDFAYLMATVRLGCARRGSATGTETDSLILESAKSVGIDLKIARYGARFSRSEPSEYEVIRSPLSFELARLSRDNFDFTSEEWLATMLMAAYRQAGHGRIGRVERVRTIAWMTALNQCLKKLGAIEAVK